MEIKQQIKRGTITKISRQIQKIITELYIKNKVDKIKSIMNFVKLMKLAKDGERISELDDRA